MTFPHCPNPNCSNFEAPAGKFGIFAMVFIQHRPSAKFSVTAVRIAAGLFLIRPFQLITMPKKLSVIQRSSSTLSQLQGWAI